ncbi:non-specific serine,threonine protein kinase, partial [Sarracenia purpurea var. burkii]
HSLDYFDAQKEFPRSCQASDEEDSAGIAAAMLSAPSIWLIASLQVAIANDSEGSVVRAVSNSLVDMECMNDETSSEVLVTRKKYMQFEGIFVESSAGVGSSYLYQGKVAPERAENSNPEVDIRKKQPNMESNTDLISLLARFLLSRLVGV